MDDANVLDPKLKGVIKLLCQAGVGCISQRDVTLNHHVQRRFMVGAELERNNVLPYNVGSIEILCIIYIVNLE